MGLIDGVIFESNYFISVYEALGLVVDHTNESLEDVAIYLDDNLLSVFIPVYEKNAVHKYKCVNIQKYNDYKQTHVFELTDVILQEMAKTKALEDDESKFSAYTAFRDKYLNCFWLRHDFFNNEGIASLGIIDDLAELQTDNIYLDARKSEAERTLKVRKIQEEKEEISKIKNSKENFDLKSHISSVIQNEKNKYIHTFYSLQFLANHAEIELSELVGYLINQDFYKGMKIYIASDWDFHTHFEIAEHKNQIADLNGNKPKNGTDALLDDLVKNFEINTLHYEVETKYFVRYWTVEDFMNNPIVQNFKIEETDIKKIQDFTAEKVKNWQNDCVKSIDKISNLEKEIASLKNELNRKDNLIQELKENSNIVKNYNEFDSSHANYPPDLHTALQLWEAHNKKESEQSWSAFANQWLSKNYSNYPEKAKDRIREIATPIVHWGSQRTYVKK